MLQAVSEEVTPTGVSRTGSNPHSGHRVQSSHGLHLASTSSAIVTGSSDRRWCEPVPTDRNGAHTTRRLGVPTFVSELASRPEAASMREGQMDARSPLRRSTAQPPALAQLTRCTQLTKATTDTAVRPKCARLERQRLQVNTSRIKSGSTKLRCVGHDSF
jgi:hypothetical protein